jgi:hypothetical protein
MSNNKILKVYGSYSLSYRRWDGEWTIKRLNAQTHSKELAEQILAEIEALPIPERTTPHTNAIANRLWHAARHHDK